MNKAPRILVITGDFDPSGTHPWLVDDLVTSLAAHGAQVDVLVADPRRTREPRSDRNAGVRIIDRSPPAWLRRPGWTRILGSRGVTRLGRAGCVASLAAYGRLGRPGAAAYDAVLYFSIGTLSGGLPNRLRRRGAARRSIFVLWDFFPVHQFEIGALPDVPLAGRVLESLERRSFARADLVAVMSPANEAYLRRYHGTDQHVIILPPWSSGTGLRDDLRRFDEFTVLFGGQLVAGRDLSVLVEAAALLGSRTDIPAINVHIAGDGPARADVEASIARLGLDRVSLLGRLPREDYREHASRCHVGVSITNFDVTVPSFPSKIPEFLSMGLPVVVACEPTTDAGRIVSEAGVGIDVASNDPAAVADALVAYARQHADGTLAEVSRRARAVWAETYSVDAAAGRLLDALS